MNDIESIAYLYASMMDSYVKIATKEIESWHQMVEIRQPEFQKEVAGNNLKKYFVSHKVSEQFRENESN